MSGLDLTRFLKARFDEAMDALRRYHDGHDGPCMNYEGQDADAYDEHDSCVLHLQAAQATPYRSVEYGLVEVDAQQRILAMYSSALEEREALRTRMRAAHGSDHGEFARLHREESELIEVARRLEPVVRALALPYAGHSDYRDEWRPAE
ncbi:DUF6221 family protein [Streptomyces lavendulocolor]|uniref:DUF6221 family protein n=1 Tax=Streptomyces lavendulocolor TaxID=67316 RepID=UPI0033F6603D